MRKTVAIATAAAATTMVVAACGDATPAPPEETTAEGKPTEQEPTGEPTAEETTEAEPFDPRSVDLTNMAWRYVSVGVAPVQVDFSDGEALGHFDRWDGQFVIEDEPLYVDMDDDGDEDVVASASFNAELQPETYQWVTTEWFVWLTDGEQLVQMPYPLTSSGDCASRTESVQPAGGGLGVDVVQNQVGWQSECAAGASISVDRTVRVEHGNDGEAWLVQTEPFPSWGGDCRPLAGDVSQLEASDVSVAPGLDAASPDERAMVDESELWMSETVDGWDFVTYLHEGDANFVSYCGWVPSS